VEKYPSKADVLKATEFRRSTINRETTTPRSLAELVTHYAEHELPNKGIYTQEVYEGYISNWIIPKWGSDLLSAIRTVAIESWLGTVPLANGSKSKVRNIMSALYSHAIRWEMHDKNPITLVRQSTKRERIPAVLTVDELKALLAQLTGAHYAMVYVAATTGLRVSEILGLRWQDCDFHAGEINLSQGVVRQYETEMKTEASRKPVPMEEGLADVLAEWRSQCAYNQNSDWVFASVDMHGMRPLTPNAAIQKRIRPAALRAGITKHIGWHTLRHSFGTLLKANGEDVATVQALMRHASASTTLHYVQAVTPAKRQAQRAIVRQLDPSRTLGRTQAIENTAGARPE
jgi:integrase